MGLSSVMKRESVPEVRDEQVEPRALPARGAQVEMVSFVASQTAPLRVEAHVTPGLPVTQRYSGNLAWRIPRS